MAITRETRKLIESENFEALEDAWLTRLAEDARDLDYYVGTARALAGNGAEEQAATLLELVDEQLESNGDWETRLDLLRLAGHLMLGVEEGFAEVRNTLARLYPKSEHFDGLCEEVGLGRAIHDSKKNWEKVAKLRRLLQFEVGTVVEMEGKGVGHVREVNLELRSFKVDLERLQGLRVGFSAAPKLLRPLPDGHFLRRKLEQPEALAQLKTESPAELLRLVLESSDGAQTAAQIRIALTGLVTEGGWTSWWGAARKHPQVLTEGSSSRQAYRWAGSSEDALQAIREAFDAADLEGQLDIFRRSAARSSELRDELASELRRRAEVAAEAKPAAALKIWWTLRKAGVADDEAPWSPDPLLRAAGQPTGLVRSLDDRGLREHVLKRVREVRDEWPTLYRQLLDQEEEPRTLTLLAEGLGEEDAELLGGFLGDVFSQPRKRPAAFVWAVERAGDDGVLADRNPLRLLQQIFQTSSMREFDPFKARLRTLIEGGKVLIQLFSRLDAEQAPQAQEAVRRAAMDEHHRTGLLNALELRFPSLRGEEIEALYADPRLDRITPRRAPAPPRPGDPREPACDPGRARVGRPARELRVQVCAPAPRVPLRPGRAARGRAGAGPGDRARPDHPRRGAGRHPGPAGARRLRTSAHRPRAVGERPRVGRHLLRLRAGAGAARQEGWRQREPGRRDLRAHGDRGCVAHTISRACPPDSTTTRP